MLLDILTGIKGTADVSAAFVTWSLTIIGVSVLTIVSTSYRRRTRKKIMANMGKELKARPR